MILRIKFRPGQDAVFKKRDATVFRVTSGTVANEVFFEWGWKSKDCLPEECQRILLVQQNLTKNDCRGGWDTFYSSIWDAHGPWSCQLWGCSWVIATEVLASRAIFTAVSTVSKNWCIWVHVDTLHLFICKEPDLVSMWQQQEIARQGSSVSQQFTMRRAPACEQFGSRYVQVRPTAVSSHVLVHIASWLSWLQCISWESNLIIPSLPMLPCNIRDCQLDDAGRPSQEPMLLKTLRLARQELQRLQARISHIKWHQMADRLNWIGISWKQGKPAGDITVWYHFSIF